MLYTCILYSRDKRPHQSHTTNTRRGSHQFVLTLGASANETHFAGAPCVVFIFVVVVQLLQRRQVLGVIFGHQLLTLRAEYVAGKLGHL